MAVGLTKNGMVRSSVNREVHKGEVAGAASTDMETALSVSKTTICMTARSARVDTKVVAQNTESR